MDSYPPIEELVPHARPMLLLDRVMASGENYLICELVVRGDGLFDTAGRVPAWLGIEYMAQTIAAFSGLRAYRRGEKAKVGFLLGSRRYETNLADYACGDILKVEVRQLLLGSSGMGSFDCTVKGSRIRQSAKLSVYEPANSESLNGILG